MSVTRISDADDGVSYKQVELDLWHPNCWTLEVTDDHPSTHVIEKSLYPTDDQIKGDFLLVADGETSIETFVEAIDDHRVVGEVAVLKQSDERARVVVNYERTSSIVPDIVNSEFMPVDPVHITEGTEHWTVLVRADRLGDVVEAMQAEYDVDVSSIREADSKESVEFADFVDQVEDRLSARQTESLLNARRIGYYNWPRDVSADAVADCLEVSKPTVLEHLRKGEQKVLNLCLDELERRQGRPR
ncbi:helix-turn-helix domain-containing protein [Halorussus gelatinilyticus]|uniref:Helix-turn-helix domain-containing protein n=1 Tax=Halorussus gelatinilyticus TaxID=2937524 RepID=A0A8U0IQ12_9EURY|nr:helix-turn-helix domain-containing protein [Halorussus gelatinilyticus]UPW02099.1 helix-turn-helix domain-containing protein [Halorussus gelatinilyticus]